MMLWEEVVFFPLSEGARMREVIRNSALDRSGQLYAPAALYQERNLYRLLEPRLDGSKN
jgi:hypothetical protein